MFVSSQADPVSLSWLLLIRDCDRSCGITPEAGKERGSSDARGQVRKVARTRKVPAAGWNHVLGMQCRWLPTVVREKFPMHSGVQQQVGFTRRRENAQHACLAGRLGVAGTDAAHGRSVMFTQRRRLANTRSGEEIR
jgi:hypothetical protein